MNRIHIRYHCVDTRGETILFDHDELIERYKKWGRFVLSLHSGENTRGQKVRDHYHVYIETEKTDNNIRQHVRKHLLKGVKQCYSVKPAEKGYRENGSYIAFKPQSVSPLFFGFTEEEISEMREYSLQCQQATVKKMSEAKPTSRAIIDQINSVVGYDARASDVDNKLAFIRALPRMKNPNMYGKMRSVYQLWKHSALTRIVYRQVELDEGCMMVTDQWDDPDFYDSAKAQLEDMENYFLTQL